MPRGQVNRVIASVIGHLVVTAALACSSALAQAPLPTSSPTVSPPSPTQLTAQPIASPPSPAIADMARILDQVGAVATKAIEAERSTVETIKWIYTVSAGLITLLVGGAAFLGYRSVREVTKPLQRELAAHSTSLQASFKRWEETSEVAHLLMLDSIEVTRKLALARNVLKNTIDETTLYAEIEELLPRLIANSERLPHYRILAWGLSLRAYCAKRFGKYESAIDYARKSLAIVEKSRAENSADFSVERHAEKHYNLACYCALASKDDSLMHLEKAISMHPQNKGAALGDPDFNALRHNERFRQLVADS